MTPLMLSALFLSACFTFPAHAQDVAGATDHPLLTRYPQFVIKWYDVQTFMPYRIAVGKVGGYRKIDEWVEAKGKVTRLYYEVVGERTHADVYANYKKALAEAGFKLMANGFHPHTSVATDIGTRNWLTIYYAANAVPASAGVGLLHGTATSGGSAFLAAKKEQDGGVAYVAIGLTQQRADRVTYLIDVIEAGDVETGLVTIDAEAMGKDIDQYGKVALYGLYFDHDKAVLKPESKPALVEIAKLLKARPTLNVYVVGHTDATGAFAYNLKLSGDRARAIVDALVKEYGMASVRLEPHGVASLAPVSINQSDGGRAKIDGWNWWPGRGARCGTPSGYPVIKVEHAGETALGHAQRLQRAHARDVLPRQESRGALRVAGFRLYGHTRLSNGELLSSVGVLSRRQAGKL